MRRMACLILASACLMSAQDARATDDPARQCRDAAQRAAAETGVPLPILSAIMLVESGRRAAQGTDIQPWPWTLHASGKGIWLASEAAARAHLDELRLSGLTNIDVGCFQINLHWHGADYPNPGALLVPLTNARHAARFLLRLHAQTGDWRKAAGRYHSNDEARAEGYLQKLENAHATVSTPPDTPLSQRPQRAFLASGAAIIDMNRRLAPLIGQLP